MDEGERQRPRLMQQEPPTDQQQQPPPPPPPPQESSSSSSSHGSNEVNRPPALPQYRYVGHHLYTSIIHIPLSSYYANLPLAPPPPLTRHPYLSSSAYLHPSLPTGSYDVQQQPQAQVLPRQLQTPPAMPAFGLAFPRHLLLHPQVGGGSDTGNFPLHGTVAASDGRLPGRHPPQLPAGAGLAIAQNAAGPPQLPAGAGLAIPQNAARPPQLPAGAGLAIPQNAARPPQLPAGAGLVIPQTTAGPSGVNTTPEDCESSAQGAPVADRKRKRVKRRE